MLNYIQVHAKNFLLYKCVLYLNDTPLKVVYILVKFEQAKIVGFVDEFR